jgi:hypothetical protein
LDDHRHDSEGSGLGYFCDETLPILTDEDKGIGRGYLYTFVGSISRDFSEGRDCWFTDVQRWYVTNPAKYIVKVNDPQHCDYTIRHPTLIRRKDGTSAIVFDGSQSGSDYRNPSSRHYDKVAILNFRSGHSRYFRAIAFYFYDFADEQTGEGRVNPAISDIRRVINSVSYSRPSM